MSAKDMTPPPDALREALGYDPVTGRFVWLQDVPPNAKRGDAAGAVHSTSGYWKIKFRGRSYTGGRLAWWLMTGEWPYLDVDHRNLCKTDNRFRNLRLATPRQNIANRRAIGPHLKGVTQLPSGRFQAQLRHKGKAYYLGVFDTELEAHQAYMARARELHGEFARAA